MAIAQLPDFIKRNVSLLNVEKVLKPPQKPMMRNAFISLDCIFPANNPTAKAMITQLNTFAINVAKGNCDGLTLPIPNEMEYRARLPSPPPRKTNSATIKFYFLIV